MPSPTFTGVRTFIRGVPYDKESCEDPRDMELPLREPQIMVTQNLSTEIVGLLNIISRSMLTVAQSDRDGMRIKSTASLV